MGRQTRSERHKKFRRRDTHVKRVGVALKTRIENWIKGNGKAVEKAPALIVPVKCPTFRTSMTGRKTSRKGWPRSSITIAPNDLMLRREFVKALNLSHDESVTVNRDLDVIAALAGLGAAVSWHADREFNRTGRASETW